ncbi:MAG: tyrosine-type recombinase/integrase [Verrucomicrobia bacterium]|nr:tyrosine-type recombinase/integrase [Verrucomicrobiota bacterium]
MKTTTPHKHPIGPVVRRFLLEEIVADRNLSLNTQHSYRDAILLLFAYLAKHHALDPRRVSVEDLSPEMLRSFLVHLEKERGNSVATRNQRLAALHSLFGFISRQVPELVEQATQVHAIPLRKTAAPTMAYLEMDEIDGLLNAPDRHRRQGGRDYALLLFLYNTGARASEVATVTIGDLDLQEHPSARRHGKGRKIRMCPLWSQTVKALRTLIAARIEGAKDAPVFLNIRGEPITRYGVHSLVVRSAAKAARGVPSMKTKRITPHSIRHTTAVHLLRAGVDINTIRAWLGHVSLETTNRYAQIDLESKAAALKSCAIQDDAPHEYPAPTWHNNDIMAFLNAL